MAHYACDPGPAKPDTRTRTRPRPPGWRADGGEVRTDASYLTRAGGVFGQGRLLHVFDAA